jgi:hypothetical protein
MFATVQQFSPWRSGCERLAAVVAGEVRGLGGRRWRAFAQRLRPR